MYEGLREDKPALGRIHLVPIAAEFLSAYPDITVRLVLGDRILSLPEEHVDVALRLGVLPDSRLMALRLSSTSRVACASPAYLALHGTPAAPEDVAGHDCIIYEGFQAPDVWTFARGQADMAITIRPRLVVSNEGRLAADDRKCFIDIPASIRRTLSQRARHDAAHAGALAGDVPAANRRSQRHLMLYNSLVCS